ncbi:MAG: glycosyltransferase involved in cell wall biosynthesis [Candidatus Poriferisodalaceae bacterium]
MASVTGLMRVALDASALVTPGTGVATFVSHLTRALDDFSDAVTVEPYTISASAGLRRTAVGRWVPIPADLANRCWGRFGRPAIDRLLGSPDLIHGTNHIVAPSARPRVVTVHDLSFVRFPEETTPAVRRFDAVIRQAAHSGAWLHVPSQFIADEVGERYRTERVVVIHEGGPSVLSSEEVARERSRSDPFAGRRVILALGTTTQRKRIPLLVEAFGFLASDRSDLQLVIAGPAGPDEDRVAAAIAQLDLGSAARVKRTGRVDDAERRRLLATSTVLAYPSVYEGFGLPVLEAMAHHTPVVACSAASVPEVAGESAELAEPDSVESLAGKLANVLDDPKHAGAVSQAGIDRVADFTWSLTAERIVDLYRQALQG